MISGTRSRPGRKASVREAGKAAPNAATSLKASPGVVPSAGPLQNSRLNGSVPTAPWKKGLSITAGNTARISRWAAADLPAQAETRAKKPAGRKVEAGRPAAGRPASRETGCRPVNPADEPAEQERISVPPGVHRAISLPESPLRTAPGLPRSRPGKKV